MEKGVTCFECGKAAMFWHHVVPKVMGGTQTVALCPECHGKIHDRHLLNWRELQKTGIEATRDPDTGKCPWGGRKIGTRVKLTVEKEAQVMKMRRDGISISTIGRMTGLTRQTIYKALGMWDRGGYRDEYAI